MEMWVFVPISAFIATAWVIQVVVDGFRRRQQIRLTTEFHGKLLDRIGSAKEFGEFLNTSGGARFLDSMTVEREGGGAPARILQALQAGLVMLTLGIGVFVLIGTTDLMIGDNPGENDEAGFAVLATITTSIGVGLLLSAGASYGLSKRLGLVDGASR
ncbi:MAG: hypothetical protein FJW14_10520 [Acidimicrobiia bacterium]|nr:hypothetical protein [Acidimicrobiia bacterium]